MLQVPQRLPRSCMTCESSARLSWQQKWPGMATPTSSSLLGWPINPRRCCLHVNWRSWCIGEVFLPTLTHFDTTLTTGWPSGLYIPPTPIRANPYPWGMGMGLDGYGFGWVRVWVRIFYPGVTSSGKDHLALAVFRCFSCPRASWDILGCLGMSQDALGLLKHLKTARARWPFPDGLVSVSVQASQGKRPDQTGLSNTNWDGEES